MNARYVDPDAEQKYCDQAPYPGWAVVPGINGQRVPSCHVNDDSGAFWFQVGPNQFNTSKEANWGIPWWLVDEHYGFSTISYSDCCWGSNGRPRP